MTAELILKERHAVSAEAYVELVVWRLASPVEGCQHDFKYRLAFVVDRRSVVRYDNERGKGDHKHIGKDEVPYTFTTPQALLDDFGNDVENWRS